MLLESKYKLNNKQAPFSIESERAVIGALLLNNESWHKIEDLVIETDFYDEQNRIIFKKIFYFLNHNIPFDIIILSDALKNENLLKKIGGLQYLAKIANDTPTISNIISYAKIINERSKLRRLLKSITEIADNIYNPNGLSLKDIIDKAEKKVLAISEDYSKKYNFSRSIKEIIPSIINKIDKVMETKNGITGISSGFIDLDKITYGFQESNLIIVAGRPSMGKTTFAMNIAENVARNYIKPVLIFSLEMPAEDLVLRMISSLGRIDQNMLRSGRIEDNSWSKITNIIDILSRKIHMQIDDSADLTPNEIRSKSRQLYYLHNGLSMIVIDYLQLIKVPGYQGNRNQEVSEISRSLKSLSKELKIPIIAISQLNRSVDDRFDKRPVMSDLRDSGAIEQDADLIMFVYRDEIYNKNSNNNKGIGEIIIGKHRNGSIGTIKVYFEGKFCKFDDLAFECKLPV